MAAIKIIPSILVKEKKELLRKLSLVRKFPLVHIDFCDGKFVNNKTIQPVDFVGIKKFASIEFHLMVNDVDHYIEHCVRLNAKSIVFHLESCRNDAEVLHLVRHIHNHAVKVGIAINPETPVSKVKKFLSRIDQVLVMTVHPGFGGQKFIGKMLHKIRALRKLDRNINIEVDGGITVETAKLAATSGANFFVAGNAILAAENVNAAYKKLLNVVEESFL